LKTSEIFNFLNVFLLPTASLYFIHDHNVLKIKTLFHVAYLDETHVAYIALEFGSQLRDFVSQAKYIRECLA
jgi:hypothetical protein